MIMDAVRAGDTAGCIYIDEMYSILAVSALPLFRRSLNHVCVIPHSASPFP